MRLGWGRGYFDKTLGSMEGGPPVYAVIYDDELVDTVPTEPHDQPVDGVVTPERIEREIEAHALDWTRFVVEMLAFDSQEPAREARAADDRSLCGTVGRPRPL